MKAQQILAYGKDQKLVMREIPDPILGNEDVLVKIHSASVNPVDFKIRDGKVQLIITSPKPPFTLGCDFAGVVEAVGSAVSSFRVGDKVYGRADKHRFGTFAEKIANDQKYLAHMPSNLSFEEASSIPLAGLTAYQALHDFLDVKAGDKVFIPGGSGGVGILAIQMAKLLGAYVITTGSEAGRALIESFQPDQFIDYTKEDFSAILKDIDYVFDTRGGDDLLKSFKILKKGGKIISISGSPNGRFARTQKLSWWKVLLLSLVSRPLTALEKQYQVSYDWLLMRPNGEQLTVFFNNWIEKGELKPVIDSIYPFEKAQEAIERVESGRAKGKIIIKMI